MGFVQLTPIRCYAYEMFQAFSGSVLVVTIDVILAFRVWILYEKSRRLLWFFVVFMSAELITTTALGIKCVSLMTTYVHLGPYLDGCWLATGNAPRPFSYYFAPTIIVSFVMFLMTVYRCLFWNNQVGIPIFSLFLRDGVFWFLAILLVLPPEIALMALPSLNSRALSDLMLMPTFAVYSLIGSRVLLNIKALLAANVVPGTAVGATFGDHTTEFRAATRHTIITVNTRDDAEA
ncbi:hypothetical protein BD779DRAFT_760684 [Infundibulicybe gibba]|nr:hypothetical protein BD779DRAFT_760684 [Infundibulicybe gibba]